MFVLFRESAKTNNVFFVFMLPVVMAMVAIMARGIDWPPASGVSMSQRPGGAEMSAVVEPDSRQVDNRLQWDLFDRDAIDFQSNIDNVQLVNGNEIAFYAQGVTFAYDLKGVAAIKPGGELRIETLGAEGLVSLVIDSDSSGLSRYQYQFNGEQMGDQSAAEGFIESVLAELFNSNDQQWRRHKLRMMASRYTSGLPTASADVQKQTDDLQLSALVK